MITQLLKWASPLILLGTSLAAPANTTDKIRRNMEAQAMYNLAKIMLEDKTIVDVSSVPKLLEDAAAAGYSKAETLLLAVYEGQFKGLPTNAPMALELATSIAIRDQVDPNYIKGITQVREQGKAMYRLARYKEVGWGCELEPTEAFYWMKAAAECGNDQARTELARYYMLGIGHKKAPIEALKLLKAQMQINPKVPKLYFYLGYMCEQGLGLRHPQYNWSIQYYTRGAELEDEHAINNLASMYERGLGVEGDKSQALRLYRHAAELGNKEASRNLQRLGYIINEEDKQEQSTSYELLINRGLLHIAKALPFDTALTTYLKAKNQELEHQKDRPY